MANTLTYTQGGYTVTISTDGANLTNSGRQIFYNLASQNTKITYTFSDGASFYLSDFNESVLNNPPTSVFI